ncbi:MAG: hexose kinase [Oscillospiraceae bacterium]|nr:hexose kinase [Oscillospiraceae bacterium]
MKIYTLTLSPAYDVHAFAQTFAAFHENLATVTSREAGGKGVNISRALAAGGGKSTAVVVLGKENAQEFRQALDGAGLDSLVFLKNGRIRENLTLHCPGVPETRISFTGFSVDSAVLEQVRDAMDIEPGTIVTFTGRVPVGIDMPQVKAFLKELQNAGARIVLDSRSFGLEDILEVRPWLIKPNQEEISMLFGCQIETVEQALEKTQVLAEAGIENVMVSLGGDGALLIHEGKVFRAVPPEIVPISTIGAGDSTIGGFIAAAQKGEKPAECLRWAAAYGTSACLTEGSQPPRLTDILNILEKVQIV